MQQTKFNWVNFLTLTSTPLISAGLLIPYVYYHGVAPIDFIAFFTLYFLTGLAITAGYHRYYSHRAYQCHPLVQLFFMVFGAGALQNSAYHWVSDHRYHHRHVDKDGDPYNINKGFLWAHIGWIFYDEPKENRHSNIRDLQQDKLVLWQRRYYIPLALLVGIGLPYLMGLPFGRPWGAVLWGGLLRLVFVHHCTFLINSAAHFFGKQPYSRATSARDSWWLAFLSYGEGYHNFHHTFPSDYRNGIAFYHWDPTKWFIKGLSFVKLTSSLKKTSEEALGRAKVSTDQIQQILEKLANPEGHSVTF